MNLDDEQPKSEPHNGAGGVRVGDGNIITAGHIVGGNLTIGLLPPDVERVIVSALEAVLRHYQPKTFQGDCPYVGLGYFRTDQAHLFFGRERWVNDLLEKLKTSRHLFIVGRSGSGKSSLARAGVVAALQAGESRPDADGRSVRLPGSRNWHYANLRPGREPLGELARAMGQLADSSNAEEEIRTKGNKDATVLHRWIEMALDDEPTQRAVLLVDQFEEIFAGENEGQRDAFLNLLIYALNQKTSRLIVIFTMRSEFTSHCDAHPQLNDLLNQAFNQVTELTTSELAQAIARPAFEAGLIVEIDLVNQIVHDMNDQPGALPLMQFALEGLFNAKQQQPALAVLTRKAYIDQGGLDRSLERHADNKFNQLSDEDKKLARGVFRELIAVQLDREVTSRTALKLELVPPDASAEAVDALIRKLEAARLIIVGKEHNHNQVMLTHEKLLTAWGWLKRLVDENKEAIALESQVKQDARVWEMSERDPSYLWRGSRLRNAYETLKGAALNSVLQTFMQNSLVRDRRDELNKRLIGVVALVLLGASMGAAVWSIGLPLARRRMAQEDMQAIDGGIATVGTNEPQAPLGDRPATTVTVATFAIEQFEVSNRRYALCISVGACSPPVASPNFDDPAMGEYPAQGVSVMQAAAFCEWIGARLPTEPEWALVAEVASNKRWPWGDQPPSATLANVNLVLTHTLPISALPEGAGRLRLFHLIGNVWEHTRSYSQTGKKYDSNLIWDGQPATLDKNRSMVALGGGYKAKLTHRTMRYTGIATFAPSDVGFRCVR